ncbi:MAG TPA: hypothetical protein ENN46_02910 [Candidatus Woesearchaeota archaeon]|nr:hypothetical protein [Candidatus Woesearchaeota archaeon]
MVEKTKEESIDTIAYNAMEKWTQFIEKNSKPFAKTSFDIKDNSYNRAKDYIESIDDFGKNEDDVTSAMCHYVLNALKTAGKTDKMAKDAADFLDEKMSEEGVDMSKVFELLSTEGQRFVGLDKDQLRGLLESFKRKAKDGVDPEDLKFDLESNLFALAVKHDQDQIFQAVNYDREWKNRHLYELPAIRNSLAMTKLAQGKMPSREGFKLESYDGGIGIDERAIRASAPTLFGYDATKQLEERLNFRYVPN